MFVYEAPPPTNQEALHMVILIWEVGGGRGTGTPGREHTGDSCTPRTRPRGHRHVSLPGTPPPTHLVQRVQQPRQEVHGLRLHPGPKTLLRRVGDRLDELVRRHGALEVARRPHPTHHFTEGLHLRGPGPKPAAIEPAVGSPGNTRGRNPFAPPPSPSPSQPQTPASRGFMDPLEGPAAPETLHTLHHTPRPPVGSTRQDEPTPCHPVPSFRSIPLKTPPRD